MTKIAVTGSRGRMGSRVVELIRSDSAISLAAEVDVGDSLDEIIDAVDVVIDFTVAKAAAENASIAARHRTPIVIGTTGLNEDEEGLLTEAAKAIPIVYSPNMSLGVNVMIKLIELASQKLGNKYKIDIVETHHENKMDKPSGTALRMLDAVCKNTGHRLDRDVFFYEEDATIEEHSEDSEISVRSIRRGEVIGEHVIYFTSPGEILSIEHHATDRNVFAEGAITAAKWVIGKPAGLYGIEDVLGLRT